VWPILSWVRVIISNLREGRMDEDQVQGLVWPGLADLSNEIS